MADAIKIGNTDITAFKVGSSNVDKIYLGSTLLYPSTPPHDYSQDYLTFVATSRMRIKNGNAFSYSINGGSTWLTLNANTYTISVTEGTKVLVKATQSMAGTFTISGGTSVTVEGNVMSLLYGDDFTGKTSVGNYALNNIFSGCSIISSAENLVLPATTLGRGCYQGMFYKCYALQSAPVLPATTLAEDCYYLMFSNCSSLATAPVLPAEIILKNSYNQMFYNCYVLSNITCLGTYIQSNGTYNWVSNVASTGTFTKAASMTDWPSGVSGIPANWTVQDYSS